MRSSLKTKAGAPGSDARELRLGFALLASLVVLSLRAAGGSYLYVESALFLHNLLGPRPLLAKIFDPNANEIVGYHARELSYLFNWLDAQVIYACTRLGLPHFYSFVHVVGISLIAGFNVVFARRRFGAGATRTSVLLSALFLTAPAVFLSNNFLRSSKIVVAAAAFFLFWRLAFAVSSPLAAPPRPRLARLAAGVALLGAVMALSDEQGVFLLTLWLGFALAVCAAAPRDRRAEPACIAAAALVALTVYACYDLWWGPKIIAALGNDPAIRHYQRVDVGGALTNASNMKEAWGLLMDSFGFQFGSLDFQLHASSGNRAASLYPFSISIAGTFLAGLALPLRTRKFRPPATSSFPLAAALLTCAALTVMFAVMIERHPPILWESVRRGYYWIPCGALLLFASTFSAGYASKAFGSARIDAALLGLLALNLLALPAHRRFLQEGLPKVFIDESPALRDCLRRTDVPPADFRLTPSGRSWCEDYRKYSAE